MIQRESNIYRDKFDQVKQKREEDARKAAAAKVIVGQAEKPKEESVRYDVAAYYQENFGSGKNVEAAGLLAGFKALQGNLDNARTLMTGLDEAGVVNVVSNYYEGLGLTGKLTGHEDLHTQLHLSPDAEAHCELKLVEFLSQNAKYAEADAVKDAGTKEFPKYHDQFIRSRMYGVFYSRTELFYLNAKTIPNLGIKDPAVCAQVLLDWFLSPNKLLQLLPGRGPDSLQIFLDPKRGSPDFSQADQRLTSHLVSPD